MPFISLNFITMITGWEKNTQTDCAILTDDVTVMTNWLSLSKTFPHGESCGHKSRKSRTQTISTCRDVCDKVCNKVHDKFPTKSWTLTWHKSWKSATWFVSRTFMICVCDTSMTLSRTCPGLCCKVGVMEFGLYTALCRLAVSWRSTQCNACWRTARPVLMG